MTSGLYVLTITDPHFKGRLLAAHHDLTRTDAAELLATYVALGYPASTCALGEGDRTQQGDVHHDHRKP